jgi:ADP-L-glycero-D-manno-heptose 6-epimerase
MIVVTGGAGMIGSAFVWHCNQQGVTDILIVDQLRDSPKWKNLVGLRFHDYMDKHVFLTHVQSGTLPYTVSAVIHMGACSATTETDGDYLMTNNYGYTKVLAEWCVSGGRRFIYASSAATYGNGDHGFVDDESLLHTLRPINRYGYSKHLFDLHARDKGWLDQIVGLKFFNVFGPNEYHKAGMRSVICKSVPEIQATGKLNLFKSHRPDYADGEQCRDFVYVKDCVAVMYQLMNRPDIAGIFNLGTGTARPWNAVASAMYAALGKPNGTTYVDMPETLQAQYQYYTEADMTKLKSKLDFETADLDTAVRDYVQSYLLTERYLGQ